MGAACAGLALPAAAAARAHPPVVVVAFDEFPTTSLLGKHRRIDAVRYPNFARLAADSTWFRNTTTIADSTFAAVPAILDGRARAHKVGEPLRPPRRSLLSLLARHGYGVHANSEANACDRRFCGRPRNPRYYLNRQRTGRFVQFIHSIGPTRRPTLWFKHTLLPHVPWIYLPSGRQYQLGPIGPIPGINSGKAAGNRDLVRLSYQRHLLQVGAVDQLLGQLLDRLHATGLYDRTLLVVVADHGVSFRLGQKDRRTVTSANVGGVGPVPLFVKRPGQRRGRVSRVYARTYDVTPTIASLLGFRLTWRATGRSAFSRAVRARRGIRISGRAPREPVVAMSAGAYQARWRAVIRYQHWLFGYGRRGPGLFGIGPNRFLRGAVLSSHDGASWIGASRISGGGRLRAHLVGPSNFRAVNPASGYVPAWVAGRITGGRRGARRNLAVTVNGRVVAVGRTFHLGRRAEQFGIVIPESALRRGSNTVRVLAVARRGGRLRLRLLGGV